VAIGLWECQSGLLLTALQELFWGRGSTAGSICGMQPVEVKGKMHKKRDIFDSIVKPADETPQ